MRIIAAVVLVAGLARVAYADCGCDRTIAVYNGPGYQTTDLSTVTHGQTVCITAGARNAAMVLNNVNGTAGDPIIIKNCGGAVQLNALNGAGMQIDGSHFRLTGTGDAGFTNGLQLGTTVAGDNALQLVGKPTDFEIDHVEITGAGYAGLMAKIDMGKECQPDLARPTAGFVMQNIKLHDLYIHDTLKGEGIYLGDSFYTGTDVYNSGSTACPKGKLQYPIPIRHVRVYNVHVHNSGREGIQVGGADDDVEVYGNLVELYGQDNYDPSQIGGIQMGVGTTGRLYNNVVIGGVGEAIVIQGSGEDYVYNNVVVGAGGVAVSVNTRATPLISDIVPKTYRGGVYIMDNTLIDTNGKGAIIEYVNSAPKNVLYNNFIVSAAAKWNLLYTYTDWTLSNNTVAATTAAAKFVNAATNDYHLQSTSPALGQARDVSSYYVYTDADGVIRSANGAAGAYEYYASSPPVGDLSAVVYLDMARTFDIAGPSDLTVLDLTGVAVSEDMSATSSDADMSVGTADDLTGVVQDFTGVAQDFIVDPTADLTGVVVDAGEMPRGHDKGGCSTSGAPMGETMWSALLLLLALRRAYGLKTSVVTLRPGIE